MVSVFSFSFVHCHRPAENRRSTSAGVVAGAGRGKGNPGKGRPDNQEPTINNRLNLSHLYLIALALVYLTHTTKQTSPSSPVSCSSLLNHTNSATLLFTQWLTYNPPRLPPTTKKPFLCTTSVAMAVSPSNLSATFYVPADKTLPSPRSEIWRRM